MKRILLILGVLALSVFLFSCQTAPEEAPPEEEPETEPIEEAAVPAPDDLQSEATELRDLIMQYELGQYAEDAYDTGENAYLTAEDAYGADNELATELYTEAISSYETVVEVGVGELQSEWESQIETANAEAQELKAPRAMPDAYQNARDTLEEAQSAFEDNEYATAVTLYSESLEDHRSVVNQTREKRERALNALDEIDSNIQSTQGDIEELERQQQTFDPEAEDLIEEES
jgi:hypothetical protein